MLADDPLGAIREGDPDDESYRRAFSEIDADPHQSLIVDVREGEVVATMQLTVIPGLSRQGIYASLGFEPTHLGMKLAL